MKKTRIRFLAAGAAVALVATLAACGSDSADETTPEDTTTSAEQPAEEPETPADDATEEPADDATEEPADDGASDPADDLLAGLAADTKKDITIPIAAGWDEDVVISHLFKYALEQVGFTVDLPSLDIAPIFDGVSTGDYDLFFDAWLPNTHKNYWETYGDQVVDVGVWYEDAPLTIAVPDYMDIDSLADLQSIADDVDRTIIGIDPGAGLTDVTENSMMPTYGLDDWTLKTSSTAAMLAELKAATDNQEPIVVTLWRPHWAYAAFPIKDLEDPENAMGDPDEIHVIASTEFAEANPTLTSIVADFTMDADTLGDLENFVLQGDWDEEDYQEATAAWVAENPQVLAQLIGG